MQGARVQAGGVPEELVPLEGEPARTLPLVLVVDDDMALQFLARESLEQDGFSVEEATDGDVALEAFSRVRPDLVLLDVNMPKVDGFTVCSRLRRTAQGANTPVVIMTAADDVDAIHAAYEVGATDFITKPLNWVLLGYRLRYVLRASQTREHLAVSEARLARAQQIARLGDLELDVATGAISTSAEARRIFGLDAGGAQVEAGALWERVHPEDRDPLSRALDLATPAARAGLDVRVVLADGEERVAHVQAEVVGDGGHESRRVIATVQDVTERNQLEAQLRQAQKMDAVGKLAGGIAHDFNNLLTIITGRSQILQESLADSPQACRDLGVIRQAGDRAAALIRQLLAFSRKQLLQRKPLDLNDAVAGVEALVRQLIGSHIVPVLELDPQLDRVSADRNQMEQVILNLVVNARDAMPQGGRLCISTTTVDLDADFVRRNPGAQPGRHVALAVSDTGMGMDAAVRARIFEPFFTTKGPEKGTGLGLATVFGIVKQHVGYIAVESEPARGSTFTMYLAPLDAAADGLAPRAVAVDQGVGPVRVAAGTSRAEPVAVEALEANAPAGVEAYRAGPAVDLALDDHGDVEDDSVSDRKRILVVDDNPDVSAVFADYLRRRMGWAVRVAHTGRDALKILRETPIAVAILDLGLPDMDGLSVMREINRLDPRPDVIIVTGQATLDSAIEAVEAGAAGYLVKPCELAHLGRLVQRLLERSNLNQMALAQKWEAIGHLAAGVAHEINTPVQFVGDNTRFLQTAFADLHRLVGAYQTLRAAVEEGRMKPDVLEMTRTVEREADVDYAMTEVPRAIEETLDGLSRVASIVRALKEFAHPDRKELVAADINQTVANTLTVARNEIRYVADVETEFGALPPVRCHLGELSQVFLNIVVNAAHAIGDVVNGGPARGRIIVRTASDKSDVVVTISDTGAGIPESVRAKIFDPFFTTKDVGRGTGQGLAIARAVVVDKHGGSLTFESEVGRGTTFFIRLPIAGPRLGVSVE